MLTIAFVMSLMVVFGVAAVAQTTAVPREDEAALRSLMADLDQAWNRGDAKAWASHYVEDGELINILGGVFSGKDAIERRHAEILSTFFQGSRHRGRIRRMRLINSNAAIVDVDVELSNYKALPPGIQESPDHVLRTRLQHVLSKAEGRWMIVASQNTAMVSVSR